MEFASEDSIDPINRSSDYQKMYNLIEFLQIGLKKDLSITTITELLEHCTVKGLKLPKNYVCATSVKEIITSMSEIYTEDLVYKLKSSPLFSIAIDGSTDLTRCKSICLNVCYIEGIEVKWNYLHSFYFETYDAKSISNAIIKFFDKHNIDWKNKMSGFGSDGEKTVRSKQNGVYGLLRQKAKILTDIHCFAHSFSLVHKTDLSEAYPILNEIFQLSYETYKYFNYSAKRLKELFDQEQEVEEIMRSLNLIKPIKVRWLSLFNSISRIIKIIKPLFLALEKSRDNLTIKGLLTIYKDPRSLSWIFFLGDLSGDIKVVTTVFQQRNFDIKRALDMIGSVKSNLTKKYIDEFSPGHTYSSYLSKILVQNDKATYSNLIRFRGSFDGSKYKDEFKHFCKDLITAIDKRFCDLYKLSDFIYFDINYLKKNASKVNIVKEAIKTFPKLLKELNMEEKVASVSDEFSHLISIINQSTLATDSNDNVFGELLNYQSDILPDCNKLICMYRVLPLTNVENERTFSKQNRIKTKYRASIDQELLTALLKVNATLTNTQKDNNKYIGTVIQRWREEKERRYYN